LTSQKVWRGISIAVVNAHTSGVFVVDELYLMFRALLNSWFDKIF
jgi:hypothetical protein